MATELRLGWRSPIYSEVTAKEWEEGLHHSYTRATEFLLEITAQNRKSLVKLARCSQRGWEIFKWAVKAIEHSWDLYDKGFYKTYSGFLAFVNNNTIQLLSSLVREYALVIKNEANSEYLWLTHWYRHVLSWGSDVRDRSPSLGSK